MPESSVPGSGFDVLPRCCPRHPDWATLSEHLLVEFPSVPVSDVVREVRVAMIAATSVGLPDEAALDVGELIARQQLMLACGRRADVARLDPERHGRIQQNASTGSDRAAKRSVRV